MNILNKIEKFQISENKFKVGDKVCVNFTNFDDSIRKKNYTFEGLIIALKNNGLNTTCTIRKVSFGEGVEKTFFIHNPNVKSISIIKTVKHKKSKLYYMRKKRF